MSRTNISATIRSTLFMLFLAFVAGGCSTNKVDWASRIGQYTFDQAIIELGPPDKQATLSDGTRVADWMTRRGGTRQVAIGPYYTHGDSGYGPYYPTYVTHQIPDFFLRLVFDPAGNLLEWKKLAR